MAEQKKRGRPRKDAEKPAPAKPYMVDVWDFRTEPRFVIQHANVPPSWTIRDVVERMGIGEHLTVYRHMEGGREIIQRGRLP